MIRIGAIIGCLAALTIGFGSAAQAAQYEMIKIGHGVNCFSHGECVFINNSGQIAGTVFIDGNYYSRKPFVWENGQFDYIDDLLGESAVVTGLANDGTMIGYVDGLHTNDQRPCYWDKSGPHYLELPQGCTGGMPHAINDHGEIVGTVFSDDADYIARWDSTGVHIQGLIPDYKEGFASDINNDGIAVADFGYRTAGGSIGDLTSRYWDDTGLHELNPPTFPLSHEKFTYVCMVNAINDSGAMVGTANSDQCTYNIALWDSDGIHDLGVGWGAAYDINNNGIVVGDKGFEAFVKDADGVQVLSGIEGSTYNTARQVNKDGWIVGFSDDGNGTNYAVLWRPVPEPSSIVVLLGGIGSVGGMIIRRKRK